MQAVILAGGKGSRLAEVTGDVPKPLVDICGIPLIGRQLQLIADTGWRDVLILAGYGADAVADYCGDGSRWGLNLVCHKEHVPRGTAGAVIAATHLLHPTFALFYGDTVMDVDLERFKASHHPGTAATLFLHPNDHPQDSDLVEVDSEGWVDAFHPYPHHEEAELPNLVNAALYILDRDTLMTLDGLPNLPDFGKHVFPKMLSRGFRIRGYRSPEYIKDAGTPRRVQKVRRDVAIGRVAALSLKAPRPAVFLDRDGVLNIEKNRITRPLELELIDGVGAALARLNASFYRTVVVTNQPVVARGDCTTKQLSRIHARLDTLLGKEAAYVDALYYCPHHPDSGYTGEVKALKMVCRCRKPSVGLIEKATAELNIDLSRSWMVGDTTVDVEMAYRAGLRSILVRTGHGGSDRLHAVTPDFVVDDLAAAVRLILDEHDGNVE